MHEHKEQFTQFSNKLSDFNLEISWAQPFSQAKFPIGHLTSGDGYSENPSHLKVFNQIIYK